MKNIIVKLEVPIPTEENVSVSAMIFHRWLPHKDGQGISIKEENIEVNINFDINSIIWAREKKIEDIHKYVNVTVYRLFVDIIVKNIDDKLIKFMQENIKVETIPSQEMRTQFENLGKRILDITIHHINRLITYCRVEKGQFWLVEFPKDYDMSNYYSHFKAQAKVLEDNSNWFRWRPTHKSVWGIGAKVDKKSYIQETDWENIKKYVYSKNRPNIILELLSKSENFAANGNRRNAIIDCMIALELALFEFSKKPSSNLFNNNSCNKVDFSNLHKQVEHLGFSASIRYLVPLIFDNSFIKIKDLQNCFEAINIRGNVVHNGQRDVDEKVFYEVFFSVKTLCKLFIEYTLDGIE